MEELPTRQDDVVVLEIKNRVKNLEGKLEAITMLQNRLVVDVSSEADDHAYIRVRVAEVDTKLHLIEESLAELKLDKVRRAEQVTAIMNTLAELNDSIEHMHDCLKTLKTGEHAAVHAWVESKMQSEHETRALKKKVYELVVTRTVGAIVLTIFTLIGLGVVSWIRSLVETAP